MRKAVYGKGRQLVRELNLRYVKVYMLCRSLEKGRQAARQLFSQYGCDATRMIFAEEFDKKEEKLDILINNAGIMLYPKFEKTKDGHEMTWQSNYLGHFLLTEFLLPKLEKSEEGGRIVNVSSKLHDKADTVDMEICDSKKHFDRWMKTYARSKLANVMHASALTKRIRSKIISANSCHPGVVDSSLVRSTVYTNFIKKVFSPIIWFVLKTEQDGAQTPLYLALSKKINGISGKYFSDCELVTPHRLLWTKMLAKFSITSQLRPADCIILDISRHLHTCRQ
uniref:Uncharacterized protein n=1 Tax=Ditylenchus dipsaci TaxID=166011 RepID=A0A915CQR1_9BILA